MNAKQRKTSSADISVEDIDPVQLVAAETIVRRFFEPARGAVIPAVRVLSSKIKVKVHGHWRQENGWRAARYEVYRTKAGNISSICRGLRPDPAPRRSCTDTDLEASNIARNENRTIILSAGRIAGADWISLAQWVMSQ
jgi:hypothetical protein